MENFVLYFSDLNENAQKRFKEIISARAFIGGEELTNIAYIMTSMVPMVTFDSHMEIINRDQIHGWLSDPIIFMEETK